MQAHAIIDDFKCPICLDLCEDAVESSCCKHIYCKECSTPLKQCSLCREVCKFETAIFAQRLIDKVPVKCQFCNYSCLRADIKNHYKKCEKYPSKCPLEKCESKIAQENILEHLFKIHKIESMNNLNKIIDIYKGSDVIKIDTIKNTRGFDARLGETGKYYCGKSLDGPFCVCCADLCGPKNGCNCSSCMQLDLKARCLPRGWLVNREGFAARKGSTGLFYCGRFVMQNVKDSDGYCGPNDGPNCLSCKKLDVMIKNGGRYNKLIQTGT